MLNTSFGKCPFEDWERASKMACSPSENFHCLQDEFGRIGWLCTEPIWVEKGRCPVYNSGAKKLDSVSCITRNCPSENYRSNYVYIKKSCRLNIENIERKKIMNSTVSTDTGINTTVPLEYIAIIAAVIMVLIAGIILVFYFRRRCNAHQKVPTSEHDKREEDIILSNLNDTSKDTYTRAGNCLTLKRFVVLRGVQGSGKTYLAKKLAGKLADKISKTVCQVHWINDVLENKIPSLTTKTLIVLDDIFYELQSEDEIQTVIKEVEELYDNVCSSKSLYTIITIPTLVWKRNSDNFQNKTCFRIYVNLDTLSTEERMDILQEHLNRRAIKDEGIQIEGKLMMRENVKSAIINFERYDYIGYPSCVAWISRMQNQFDLHDAGRFIEVPITRIKSEIYRLSNAKNIKERKMFLLLAFMTFNDGKLNLKEMNKDQLMDFAKILFPPRDCRMLNLQEDDPSLFSLQERYIRRISDGVYEFYLDAIRKIVFVVALEKNFEALKMNVSQYMWKRFVVQKAKLPADLTIGELTHMFVKL